MLCYILEDNKTKQLYEGLRAIYPDWEFPITHNILSPLDYLDEIITAQPDYILLDNYFPAVRGGLWVDPLGAQFLEAFITSSSRITGSNGKTGKIRKIIAISNNGKRLLEKYPIWQEAYDTGLVIGFAPGKSAEEVQEIVESVESV